MSSDPISSVQSTPESYQQSWTQFWAPICTHGDGSPNLDAIQRELHDYRTMLEQVGLVYAHVSNGRFSQPNHVAQTIIDEHERVVQEAEQEAVKTYEAELAEAHERLTELAKHAATFIRLLEVVETNDDGTREFRPNTIASCRALDARDMNEVLTEMRRIAREVLGDASGLTREPVAPNSTLPNDIL